MAVNIKMGVDLKNFNSGIKEGQRILKGLNAEMKATDAEFKATGNAEQMLTNKTKTLNSQINIQKGIIDKAKKALELLDKEGVQPTDADYQKLYATMMNATAGMNSAQAELNALDASQTQAAKSAEQLSQSVGSIGKKISLDQVISGIDKITDGLERGAQKAMQLGEEIWNSIMRSAQWADDTATQAQMFGIDIETFERMQKLVVNGLDTTVEAMLKSQQKFNKNVGEGNDEFMNLMADLELATRMYGKNGEVSIQPITEDSLDLFFRAGQAIMNLGDEYEKEAAAQKLFGKSWRELVPLFEQYKSLEEYNEALESTQINSEDDVKALSELNDKVSELKGNMETLSNDIMAQLAPALTSAANALNGVLTSILEYMETPEGKEMLKNLGDSVSKLFEDLGQIDPASVVDNFTKVFNGLIDGLKWIVENRETLKDALVGVVGAWGAMKIGGSILTILKLIDGLKGLGLMSGGGEAAAAGAAGGGWTTGIFSKISGALPDVSGVMNFWGPMMDWLTHESPFAGMLTGQQSVSDFWSEFTSQVKENASTFESDWRNNPLTSWAFDMGENAIKFWDNFWNGGNGPAFTPTAPEEEDWRPSYMKEIKPIDIEAIPVAPENAAETLENDIGTLTIPAKIVPDEADWRPSYMRGYANGIWSVPYDGMLARLHKGERVVPAREVQSRNYSSNLYVESMYMNGGTDAAGLAAAMAAAQRRQMSGYGS